MNVPSSIHRTRPSPGRVTVPTVWGSGAGLRLAVLALGALTLLSPVRLRSWRYGDGALAPVPLGAPGRPALIPPQADLDGDGTPETLTLTSGRLAILSNGESRWQSPAPWSVRQAAFTDLNHDGRPEVTLMVWRAFQPWPTDKLLPHAGRIAGFHDAAGRSCHLILIGPDGNGGYRELWAGSALADPISIFAAADLDRDGRQELVTLEGRYDDPAGSPARGLKIWMWDGFGFVLTDRADQQISKIVILESAWFREIVAQIGR